MVIWGNRINHREGNSDRLTFSSPGNGGITKNILMFCIRKSQNDDILTETASGRKRNCFIFVVHLVMTEPAV
jgi:hypothetical protein